MAATTQKYFKGVPLGGRGGQRNAWNDWTRS